MQRQIKRNGGSTSLAAPLLLRLALFRRSSFADETLLRQPGVGAGTDAQARGREVTDLPVSVYAHVTFVSFLLVVPRRSARCLGHMALYYRVRFGATCIVMTRPVPRTTLISWFEPRTCQQVTRRDE
jgi:hypothetical protein